MRFSIGKYPIVSRLGTSAVKIGPLILYIGTIFLANWSLSHLGNCAGTGPCTIPVWFGLNAPSGVLWVGLAFSLRDAVQERLGRVWAVGAILVGAALSAFLSPSLALASGVAFLLSEGVDFLIYTPIREQGRWLMAVALSNTVGLIVDSVLFLSLAFGSLGYLPGQVLGKFEVTLLTVALLFFYRRQAVEGMGGIGYGRER